LFVYGGEIFTWSSKKQAVVVLWSTEAETLAAAAQETVWLKKLLLDLQLPSQPLVMMEDDQGAMVL